MTIRHIEMIRSRTPPGDEEESAAASWKVLTGPTVVPVRDPNSISWAPVSAAPAWVSHIDLTSTLLLGATMSPADSRMSLNFSDKQLPMINYIHFNQFGPHLSI